MTTKMQAAQVYFPKADYARIKAAAKRRGMSLAAFIRKAALREEADTLDEKSLTFSDIKPFTDKFDGANDGAINHDKYLY